MPIPERPHLASHDIRRQQHQRRHRSPPVGNDCSPISHQHEKDQDRVFEDGLERHPRVVDARNFPYSWIYTHRKVLYSQHLLEESIRELARQLAPDALERIFSLETFSKVLSIGGANFYRPTDGDFIYLLKSYSGRISAADEWLSRRHRRKALWKTRFEFNRYFEGLSKEERADIRMALTATSRLNDWGRSEGLAELPIALEVKIKTCEIHPNDILIAIPTDKGVETASFPSDPARPGRGRRQRLLLSLSSDGSLRRCRPPQQATRLHPESLRSAGHCDDRCPPFPFFRARVTYSAHGVAIAARSSSLIRERTKGGKRPPSFEPLDGDGI